MMFKKILKESLKTILNEGGQSPFNDIINKAINNARRVELVYPDSKTGEPVRRSMFIYNYGGGANGDYIRTFQMGSGGSGGLKWKLLKVDKIIDIKLTRMFVKELPSDVPSYRIDGDKQIPNMYNMMNPENIKSNKTIKNTQKLVDKSKPNQEDNLGDENNNDNNASSNAPIM